MSLGSLRVLLGLDAAEFTRGLTKAEQEAQKFQRGMVNVGKTIGTAVGTALGASLTVGVGAAILFEKLIGKAAGFQDLAEKTGASAEALASLHVAASVTNTSMETLGNLSVKLTKGLAGTDEETKQAANAIRQLGIDVDSFRKLDPAAQFEVIGQALNRFEDGAGKTAFAVAALGRSGADALPFLKELGAQGQRNVVLTEAQIRAADDYKDSQARLRAEIELYATRLATNVLPVVQDFQKALFETAKQILGVSEAGAKLAGTNDVQEFADKAARGLSVLVDGADLVVRAFQVIGLSIASIAAQATALLERNLAGVRQIKAESSKAIQDVIDRPLFSSNLQAQQERSAREREIAADPDNRRLANRVAAFTQKGTLDSRKFGGGGKSGGADKAAQEQRKLLDKQLSDLENFSKAEQRLLESRNNSLDRLYDQDQLSIADYFAGKAAALDRATFEQADIYNEQIALLEKFYNETKEQTAKLDALKEIGRFKEKRSELLADRSNQATKDFDDSARAASEYAGQVAEVQARVLELQGTEEAAARAALQRFDIQNRALLNRARLEPGGSVTEAGIGQLRAREEAQTRINALLRDASVIEQNLATAQAKLHLERDLGMRDEIDSYKALASSSTDAAAKLQVIADKYLAIARADGSAVLIANAEAFKQKVTEMAAATDILAAKLRQTFVDTGASAIETFLNNLAEGKNALDSFKEAFKQFANDIIRQINRIAAQKIADSLFKSGSGGNDGGVFGSIADAFVQYIGGIGGQEKGGPVAGRTAYIVGERGPEIFIPQTAAAEASKQIDSLIAQRGKPAEYNGEKVAAIAANLPHMIGAKGPEIFVPKTSGIVIPNDKVTKLATVLEKQKQAPSVRRETILREEKIIKRYANAPSKRDTYIRQSAKAIEQSQRAVASLAPRQRRAAGGHVTASTPYIVGELGPELFMPKEAGRIIKNEKAIDALISNTTQRRNINQFTNENNVTNKVNKVAIDRLVSNIERTTNQANLFATNNQTFKNVTSPATNSIVTNKISELIRQNDTFSHVERELLGPGTASSEKITDRTINNSTISKLLTRQQNEKAVISNLRNVEKTTELLRPAEKIINNKISKLISDRQINNLKSVEKTTELLRPASNIVRHELSEFVSNIQNNQTTNESVQRRANGGPVAAYQTYLVGERGAEIFVPHDVSVPSDFFTNDTYRRARGGMVNANRPYIVGERGPEMFVPKTAGQIVTNNRIGGANTTNISISVPGGTNAATANQIAAAVSRQMAISNARYN